MCCSRSQYGGSYRRRQSTLVLLYNAYKASREQQYQQKQLAATTTGVIAAPVASLPAPPSYESAVGGRGRSRESKRSSWSSIGKNAQPTGPAPAVTAPEDEYEAELMSDCKQFIERYRAKRQ